MRVPGIARMPRRSELAENVAARIGALVSLGTATVLVARVGGRAAVGVYALLRVLPGLAGVAISSGLPGAVAYFLAGPSRDDRRLSSTLITMAIVGGAVATLCWEVGTSALTRFIFPNLTPGIVAFAGLTVFTQLIVATGKSCCQGRRDLPGANWVILFEELMFLPFYGLVWISGGRGYVAMITALLLADVLTAGFAWSRLARRGFFRRAQRASISLARSIAAYGLRAQVGGIVSLLNLRLDFILLDALAGPAALGPYAIASKFAELLKIPALALTYVLYPRFARDGRAVATAKARAMIRRAGILVGFCAVPLWVAAGFVLPALYGQTFQAAITPTHILLIGLAVEGCAGVITGFLYGIGRPGLNSWGMGAGLTVTLALDIVLIPSLGAIGAAWASTAAYLTSTGALLLCFELLTRSPADRAVTRPVPVEAGVE